MARWRLSEDHYLFGYPPDLEEGCEWEYKETDRLTGRERRKRFKVPFFMDRESIVCYAGRGQSTDTIFEGDPTPAMEPIDDEARNISASFKDKWVHPIESLPGQGFADGLLTSLTKQLERISNVVSPTPAGEVGITRKEFEALQDQLASLMMHNAELQAKLEPEVEEVEEVEEEEVIEASPPPAKRRPGFQRRVPA